MASEIGQVEAIFRYPVKSMGGEQLEAAELGWHGVEGDRRLALRRLEDRSAFPWLSASRLPELLRYSPVRRDTQSDGDVAYSIRTPNGELLDAFGETLAAEISSKLGSPVQMMQLKHGVFDEASVSIIAPDTISEIGRLAGRELDVRRFRPNIVIRLLQPAAFAEDGWVRGSLSFGAKPDAAAVAVTLRDLRCSMINLDPDSSQSAPEVMKAVVRVHQNTAGVYGAVVRAGHLEVGQTVLLHPASVRG
ncbi:MAG: MOSC domain-containing protein [Candidatus Eisenbacteria bacterium]|nr:MOSC domain-containing protein [Candidatus Eisenbacteria bacterium]